MCNCYYYDRAVHISVAVDMRTLLDRNNFSSSSNGQVAAHQVTGLIISYNIMIVIIVTSTYAYPSIATFLCSHIFCICSCAIIFTVGVVIFFLPAFYHRVDMFVQILFATQPDACVFRLRLLCCSVNCY